MRLIWITLAAAALSGCDAEPGRQTASPPAPEPTSSVPLENRFQDRVALPLSLADLQQRVGGEWSVPAPHMTGAAFTSTNWEGGSLNAITDGTRVLQLEYRRIGAGLSAAKEASDVTAGSLWRLIARNITEAEASRLGEQVRTAVFGDTIKWVFHGNLRMIVEPEGDWFFALKVVPTGIEEL